MGVNVSHRAFIAVTVCVQITSLLLFLRAFFPLRSSVPGRADINSFPPGVAPPTPVYKRLVIVLVDALRHDFVFNTSSGFGMPYTYKLIKRNEALAYIARAHPPTVTMPRIKALTTGSIPGFIDVALNFDSSALNEDNLISQLQTAGKRIVFFGDDTWIRLFPGHFERQDGVTSFFVSDYTEVDSNVTRHLDRELVPSPDWDVMVLHYLGLDHIGHLAGPRSPLVPGKLAEMDAVIRKIHETLKQQDTPSLMVLCGDHGMTAQGSHGGATPNERNTPLVLIGTPPSLQQTVNHCKDAAEEVVDQIDLVPTLSILLGVPIPQNNLGAILCAALCRHSVPELLTAFQINSYQLLIVYSQSVPNPNTSIAYHLYWRAVRSHQSLLEILESLPEMTKEKALQKVIIQYVAAMDSIRDSLVSKLSKYDMPALIAGIVLFWMTLLCTCWGLSISQEPGIILMLYKHLAAFSFVCGLVSTFFYITLCTGRYYHSMLCPSSRAGTIIIGSAVLLLTMLIPHVLLCACTFPQKSYKYSFVKLVLWLGLCLHSVSLLSSSFVEEEHQTYYFLTTSLLVAVIYDQLGSYCKWERQLNMTGCSLVATTVVLVTGRILRVVNQSGIKWSDLPDLGDWLVKPEHKLHLSAVVSLSLVLVVLTQWLNYHSATVTMTSCLATVTMYLHHAANNVVLPRGGLHSDNASGKNILEVRVFHVILVVFLVQSMLRHARLEAVLRDIMVASTLFTLLLMRPHNVVVIAGMVVQHYCLTKHILPYLNISACETAILFVWMGQATFYQQGNSNSLSTVDVAAGYVGLRGYQPLLIGLQIICATYSGPIFWILALILETRPNKNLRGAWYGLMLTRCLPVALYSILVTVERYHLFVWSVFSPKLLYESMMSAIVALLLLTWVSLGYRPSHICRSD